MRLGSKPEYKWVILGLCFLMNFVTLGFCSSNKGMYLTAVTAALGFKRSLFSINDTCRYIAAALINLCFGTLIYRHGVRKMVGFGFAAVIGSTLIYATAESVVAFYIGGILLGIGLTFTTTTMTSCIIRRWFKTNMGRYTGIAFAANGIGGALAAQIAEPLINRAGDPFGYRTSYYVTAGILLITGIAVMLFLREWPERHTAVIPEPGKKAQKPGWHGIDFDTAKKRPWFYLTGIIVFITGFILQGITGVYAAHMKDVGLDSGYIAVIVSTFLLVLTVSKILTGIIYDRYGLGVVMTLCQITAVVAFAFVAFLDATVTGMVLAMVFALLYALSLPLETLGVPLIAIDLFGAASYDKILGFLLCMNYAGYALGAPVINLCYDLFGSYKQVLLVCSILMLVLWVVFRFVLRAADKEKKASVSVN